MEIGVILTRNLFQFNKLAIFSMVTENTEWDGMRFLFSNAL
jgi:hypothetical protein